MKKLLSVVLILACVFSLTSCRVNWFGKTADVEWYVIAIPVVIIFVIAYIILMSMTFVCPSCKTEFKPKWYQLSVGFHYMGKRWVKCPKCGAKGFFKRKK